MNRTVPSRVIRAVAGYGIKGSGWEVRALNSSLVFCGRESPRQSYPLAFIWQSKFCSPRRGCVRHASAAAHPEPPAQPLARLPARVSGASGNAAVAGPGACFAQAGGRSKNGWGENRRSESGSEKTVTVLSHVFQCMLESAHGGEPPRPGLRTCIAWSNAMPCKGGPCSTASFFSLS